MPRLRGRPADQRRGARRGQRRSQGEEGLVSLAREKRHKKKGGTSEELRRSFTSLPASCWEQVDTGFTRGHLLHRRGGAADLRGILSEQTKVVSDTKEKH